MSCRESITKPRQKNWTCHKTTYPTVFYGFTSHASSFPTKLLCSEEQPEFIKIGEFFLTYSTSTAAIEHMKSSDIYTLLLQLSPYHPKFSHHGPVCVRLSLFRGPDCAFIISITCTQPFENHCSPCHS